jgi:DNA-directed RNA polymerase subunit N (RpoN/RPB10)
MELITDLTPHITVSMSTTYGEEWKALRCSLCGNVVCQYNEDFIRTITPSGNPVKERPGKVIQCQGVLVQYKPKDTFDMMFELFETVQAGDIAAVQAKVIELAKDNQKASKMCKAKYYVG